MTKFTRYTVNRERERFHKESLWKRLKMGSISIRVIIFGLIILVGFVYLVQINRVSTGGFEIKKLTERMGELKNENKKLELEIADLKSLKVIKETSQALNLVGVSRVDYVTLPQEAVALGE